MSNEQKLRGVERNATVLRHSATGGMEKRVLIRSTWSRGPAKPSPRQSQSRQVPEVEAVGPP